MAAAHFTLNTGARVPSVGLGTYKAAPGVIADVLGAAVKVPAPSLRPLFPQFKSVRACSKPACHGNGRQGTGTSTARRSTITRRRLVS